MFLECHEDYCPSSSPGLASPVKEIWFAEVKDKSLTLVGFEPPTSGVDHQRSNC